MNTLEETNIMVNLERIVEKQIEQALKGNFNAVEKLAQETNAELDKLFSSTLSQVPDFETKKQNLLKMYRKLDLMLSAEKQIVKEQVKTVDNVRKTLSAYSNKA
ncbi:MAG: hypothetical protein ABFD79_04550 [Phycisphaerales bacterium]